MRYMVDFWGQLRKLNNSRHTVLAFLNIVEGAATVEQFWSILYNILSTAVQKSACNSFLLFPLSATCHCSFRCPGRSQLLREAISVVKRPTCKSLSAVLAGPDKPNCKHIRENISPFLHLG